MTDDLILKNAHNFICTNCDFKCIKESEFCRHKMTRKHKNTAKILTNTAEKTPTKPIMTNKFICDCGKYYKHRQSLFNHKKICCNKDKFNEILINDCSQRETYDKELIILLIKQNSQLIKDNSEFKNIVIEQQNIMLEVLKNGTNNTTNSHNKTFNLQFFLNETCKNAMNIMDFVDSIKLQLSDLENVGKLGYVEGISNIITKNLDALDVTQRPIHCADKKREVIYIKDQDKWEKEDEQKNKLKKVIHRVACKNQRLIPKFKEEHPDCLKSSSKFSDQYNKIIVESMGGSGDNDIEKEDKIIRNISRQVLIDK